LTVIGFIFLAAKGNGLTTIPPGTDNSIYY
jgi:hypothetical protein